MIKNKSNIFIFGSFIIILFAIVIVVILNATKPSNSSTDPRAQASTKNTLKLSGVIASTNESTGVIEITDIQFSDVNRSGEQKLMGNWTVTVPSGFNFATLSPGMTATIGIDASTFNIAKKTVTALTLAAGN